MAHNRTSALQPIGRHLHLWTLCTVRSHLLLAHFLQHYAAEGVSLRRNAHVVLHDDFASAETVQAARTVLNDAGVQDVSFQAGVDAGALEGIKLKRLNAFIKDVLPANAWLIFADVDEFFTYPCNLLDQLKQKKMQASCSFMQDRITTAEKLPAVAAAPSIEEQFPLCAQACPLPAR